MLDHRASGNRVEHFRRGRFHPRALPCGKNNHVNV
jgi:hypothetical protein